MRRVKGGIGQTAAIDQPIKRLSLTVDSAPRPFFGAHDVDKIRGGVSGTRLKIVRCADGS